MRIEEALAKSKTKIRQSSRKEELVRSHAKHLPTKDIEKIRELTNLAMQARERRSIELVTPPKESITFSDATSGIIKFIIGFFFTYLIFVLGLHLLFDISIFKTTLCFIFFILTLPFIPDTANEVSEDIDNLLNQNKAETTAKPLVIAPIRLTQELRNTNALLSLSPLTATIENKLIFADKASGQIITNNVVINAFDKIETIDLSIATEKLKNSIAIVESSLLSEMK